MRRYTIAINGSDHEVDVEEVTANTFRVQIAGTSVDVRLRDHQDLAQAMITPQMEVVHAPVAQLGGGGATAAPAPGAAAAGAAAGAPAAAASAPRPRAAAGGGGANALTAPMPGVVLSISASSGQQVKRGDPLLVLEAMKMKNEL